AKTPRRRTAERRRVSSSPPVGGLCESGNDGSCRVGCLSTRVQLYPDRCEIATRGNHRSVAGGERLCPKKGVWNSPASINVGARAPESSRHLFLGKAVIPHGRTRNDWRPHAAPVHWQDLAHPGGIAG